MKKMISFAAGPVQISKEIKKIGSKQIPYFRTDEFSNVVLENEKLIKKLLNASEESKVACLTASGTGAMEAAICNTLTKKDKALIVNGGTFGKRFVELCEIYEIPFEEIKLDIGEPLTEKILRHYSGKDFTTFIVNIHETSTGVHYDPNLIGEYCKKNNLFLIIDAVSSFLADEFNMKDINADVVLISSQKALACHPGISYVVLSEEAIKRVYSNDCKCMYLNLKDALDNAKRGQTPFTPAIGIIEQINYRLKEINNNGGVEEEIRKTKEYAMYFRKKIKDLPFEILDLSPSNAITAIHPINAKASEIFLELKNNYNIWVLPNGGDLKDKIFRVGHIGCLNFKDYDKLISSFEKMRKKGLI